MTRGNMSNEDSDACCGPELRASPELTHSPRGAACLRYLPVRGRGPGVRRRPLRFPLPRGSMSHLFLSSPCLRKAGARENKPALFHLTSCPWSGGAWPVEAGGPGDTPVIRLPLRFGVAQLLWTQSPCPGQLHSCHRVCLVRSIKTSLTFRRPACC